MGRFAYLDGTHLEMMRRRGDWFRKMAEQHLVLWWIPAGELPSVDVALQRLDLIWRSGSGPRAFTFGDAYGPPAAQLSALG